MYNRHAFVIGSINSPYFLPAEETKQNLKLVKCSSGSSVAVESTHRNPCYIIEH